MYFNRALSLAEIKQNMAAEGLGGGKTPVRPLGKLALAWGDIKLDR